ncbi:hypothetical protein [Lacticaseibacillus daqingensis]|uniref:hypothetical protein n=1 Tax=Lacticaseibacillus daqingensis TaxID=2486014 RepID=UPI000F794D2C|nr:hypothetical protein [Lacticaseibacillus daqingensis]
MTTLSQRVTELGLGALRPQTILRVTAAFPGQVAETGAYVQADSGSVCLTPDATSDPAALVAQLTTIEATLNAPTLGTPTFTVEVQLPEMLFERLYETASFGQQPPSYVTFRNTLYQQLAVGMGQHLPAIAYRLATPAEQLQVALRQGPVAPERPIVAARLAGVVASTAPAGLDAAALAWVRDCWWAMLSAPAALPQGPHWQAAGAVPPVVATGWRFDQPLPGQEMAGADQQLLVGAAYRRGLRVTTLDATAELVALTAPANQVFVQAGTLTGLDRAVTQAVCASKQAQKQLLGAAGLPVRRAALYTDEAAALADFHASFAGKSLVVKPNRGHGGAGISVFPVPATAAEFTAAYRAAAAFGPVLVELFIAGTATRFFVLNGAVLAVLECEPLSVVGDGRRTVAALVAAKGLTLDPAAQAVLNGQGLTPTSVVRRGHEARLRQHAQAGSGVSVAVTAEIDPSYKKLATRAAAAVGGRLVAVDMVLANRYQPFEAAHPELAAITAVSLAPSLAVHATPTVGVGQDLAPLVLTALLAEAATHEKS